MKAKGARYRVKQGEDGQWYFALIATNGRTVHPSEGYPSKGNALRGARAAYRTALRSKGAIEVVE